MQFFSHLQKQSSLNRQLWQGVNQVIFNKLEKIHADEAPIKVMDKDKKVKLIDGTAGSTRTASTNWSSSTIRRAGAERDRRKFLQGFTGYLQTDGYCIYDAFDKQESITLIHCMAHAVEAARRGEMLYSLLGTCKMHEIEPYA